MDPDGRLDQEFWVNDSGPWLLGQGQIDGGQTMVTATGDTVDPVQTAFGGLTSVDLSNLVNALTGDGINKSKLLRPEKDSYKNHAHDKKCGPDGYRDATEEEKQAVFNNARALIGSDYSRGEGAGSSPTNGFDCSGFVFYVINESGISVPYFPTNSIRGKPGYRTIPENGMTPGDVILFHGHVGFFDPGQSSIGNFLSARTRGGVNYGNGAWWGGSFDSLRIRVKC